MEASPGDETLLAGVAEGDIGALRVLYERGQLAPQSHSQRAQ